MINEAYGIAEAGGGRHRTVWYYDCDTGNVMSSRQYAKKCRVDEVTIIKQYNDSAEFGFINIFNYKLGCVKTQASLSNNLNLKLIFIKLADFLALWYDTNYMQL